MEVLQKLGIYALNEGVSIGLNQWRGHKDRQHNSYNPTTEACLGSVATGKEEDLTWVIQQASTQFLAWRNVPAPKRGDIIRQIADRLRHYKTELGQLITLETGKSLQEGLGEVQEMIDIADFAVGLSRQFHGLTLPSERQKHRMMEQWHPLGVVGVITAFNFPMAVWSWNAFIAAVCGNTVIWKPSLKTPLCAIAVQHICNQVCSEHQLEGVFSLFIPPDDVLTAQLIHDPRVALVSFTGSTSVGRHINEQVAKRLGRTLLEMGGNNAAIIDKTADLKIAIPAVVFGAIGTSGQRCTTLRRLFIHETLFETVLQHLKNAYAQIAIGDPLQSKNHMGPLIDVKAVGNFETAVTRAIQAGGILHAGGKKLQKKGYFVEPTLIEAQNEWAIVQEETFAPILYLMRFSDIETAIHMQNHSRYGLSSALFTESLRNSEYFLSACGSDCGIANINIGTSGAEIGGAFGGEKDTGGGRESGSDAWKNYMRRQTNTIHWGSEIVLAQGIQFHINVDKDNG